MSPQRILIVGGTGMLGHKLAHTLSAADELETHVTVRGIPDPSFRAERATYHEGISVAIGQSALYDLIRQLAPDVIINAAGAIKHRDLNSDAADTLFINGTLPHALAASNPNRAGRVIHFSTDCVFTGSRGDYKESDQPDAIDLYGVSKATGELRYRPHLTIRTSIIGPEIANHLGLFAWFMRQPAGATVKGYRRAIFSGLPTVTLSRTVLSLIRSAEPLAGLYHVASEPINKFELLSRIREAFGVNRDLVPTDEVAIDRSLDDSRFREETNTARPGWDELIAELVTDCNTLPYDFIMNSNMQTTP